MTDKPVVSSVTGQFKETGMYLTNAVKADNAPPKPRPITVLDVVGVKSDACALMWRGSNSSSIHGQGSMCEPVSPGMVEHKETKYARAKPKE